MKPFLTRGFTQDGILNVIHLICTNSTRIHWVRGRMPVAVWRADLLLSQWCMYLWHLSAAVVYSVSPFAWLLFVASVLLERLFSWLTTLFRFTFFNSMLLWFTVSSIFKWGGWAEEFWFVFLVAPWLKSCFGVVLLLDQKCFRRNKKEWLDSNGGRTKIGIT